MDEKDQNKFWVAPLTAESYYSWSHDMEVILRRKELWKYVEKSPEREEQDPRADRLSSTWARTREMSESKVQKRDLALAYVVTSVDQSCKSFVRKVRCPRNAWETLCKTFYSMSEAAVDAKLIHYRM